MIREIREAADYLKNSGVVNPMVGIILGTGLGKTFVSHINDAVSIPYKQIPNFPEATVESHHGKLIFGKIADCPVVVMQGRFHYYEGYTLPQVTLPVRVMKLLGVRFLLISNAAGNLNMKWTKGELMMLDDHINLQPENPLRGKNLDELGPRFPDMSQPYSAQLNNALERIANDKGISLRKGVYACVPGPNLETRAEYRFLQRIGADAVGMSTVPEVIVANHMSLPCCAVSVLTDDCDPDNLKPTALADIVAAAEKVEPQLTELFVGLIHHLAKNHSS
jgi:purine-nucleoside phosphorylase